MGSLSDEWHVMALKNGLVHSVKAVQDRFLRDNVLLEVQTWMEQALLGVPIIFKSHRFLTLSTIAKAIHNRYLLFGTMPHDAPLDTYARYDALYVQQRSRRSILRGSSNLTARA